MKIYKADKYLTKEHLSAFKYDPVDGVIKKAISGKVMRSLTHSGAKILVINGVALYQSRVVCWMNGVSFTPFCKIEHIDGDCSNIRLENLKVVSNEEVNAKPPASNFTFKAPNDKIIKLIAHEYSYDKDSGVITHVSGRVARAKSDSGYIVINRVVGGKMKSIFAHRLALYLAGDSIDGLEVDHINGCRSDNSYSNLRLVTRSYNRRNSAKSKLNTSGITGVNWHKVQGRWESRGNKSTIGYSNCFFDACCIRKSWENKFGGYTERHGVVDKAY